MAAGFSWNLLLPWFCFVLFKLFLNIPAPTLKPHPPYVIIIIVAIFLLLVYKEVLGYCVAHLPVVCCQWTQPLPSLVLLPAGCQEYGRGSSLHLMKWFNYVEIFFSLQQPPPFFFFFFLPRDDDKGNWRIIIYLEMVCSPTSPYLFPKPKCFYKKKKKNGGGSGNTSPNHRFFELFKNSGAFYFQMI